MKAFLNSISNKAKAIYLLWVLIHFLLWMFNGFIIHQYVKGLVFRWSNTNYYNKFFPLSDIQYYDISEFLFYTIVPIVLTAIIYLFIKK